MNFKSIKKTYNSSLFKKSFSFLDFKKFSVVLLFDIMFIAVFFISRMLLSSYSASFQEKASLGVLGPSSLLSVFFISLILYPVLIVLLYSFFKYNIMSLMNPIFKELKFDRFLNFFLLNLLIFFIFFIGFVALAFLTKMMFREEYLQLAFKIIGSIALVLGNAYLFFVHSIYEKSKGIVDTMKKGIDKLSDIKRYYQVYLISFFIFFLYYKIIVEPVMLISNIYSLGTVFFYMGIYILFVLFNRNYIYLISEK